MVLLLEKALQRTEELPEVLIRFYDLYCDGYGFLQDLGLGYGLACQCPQAMNYEAETWEDLQDFEKTKIINRFYPQIDSDLKKALHWITDSKIILTGERDEINHWQYIDKRTRVEKKSSMWVETSYDPETGGGTSKNTMWEKQTKKWWEFWK